VFCALHNQLASLDRHAQLTRCFSAVAELRVNVYLLAVIDEVHRRLELAGITGGDGRVMYMTAMNSGGLQQEIAKRHTSKMARLRQPDDICILDEGKTQLAAVLNVFNDVLTEYGMVLSAGKSFWMTLGHCRHIW